MTVAILAYGSLLGDAGPELESVIEDEAIEGQTRFPVAFARFSTSRAGAPTLVRVNPPQGVAVGAAVLRLAPSVGVREAREMLFRREAHRPPGDPVTHGEANRDWIKEAKGAAELEALFQPAQAAQADALAGIEHFLYVDLPPSRRRPISVDHLADRAIDSVRVEARRDPMDRDQLDGIAYLQEMIELGAPPQLTDDYRDAILTKLGARDLYHARRLVRSQLIDSAPASETADATATVAAMATAPPGPEGQAAVGPALMPAGAPPAPDDPIRSTVVKVAAAAAAGVGVLGFVTLIGGAYYWLRFSSAGLPADEAVGDLSRSQLLVVGVRELFPFLLIAAIEVAVVYMLELAVRGRLTPGPLRRLANYAAKAETPDARRLAFRARAGAVLAGAVLAVITDLALGDRNTAQSILLTAVVAGGLALIVIAYAASSDLSYTRFVLALLTATAVFALFSASSRVSEAPFVRPVALVLNGKPLAGIYITASSDQVYLGEVCTDRPGSEVGDSRSGSLLEVPRADVSLILVGDNAGLELAIERERSLLEALQRLNNLPAAELAAAAPPALSDTRGVACTEPAVSMLPG